MAKYYRVTLGTIHFTDNGAAGGVPCRVEVEGAGVLGRTKTGGTQLAADLTPYSFVSDWDRRGSSVSIRPTWLTTAVYDSVLALVNALDPVSGTLQLDLVGDPGSHSLLVVPRYPDWLGGPARFRTGRVFEPVFNFVVKSRVGTP